MNTATTHRPTAVRLSPAAVVFLPVVGTALLTLVGSFDTALRWIALATGLGALGLAAWLQVWLERQRSRALAAEQSEATRLRVAMRDALQPVAEMVAVMPGLGSHERLHELKPVAVQAVGAITLLLKDVDRLRAVVYQLLPDGSGMTVLAYTGRGGTDPRRFTAGTPRGDTALALVRSAGHRFVRALDPVEQVDDDGTIKSYRTFIAASITSGDSAYGMVTVDAPRAGDLADTDQQIVLVVADLLAIAFAIADSR